MRQGVILVSRKLQSGLQGSELSELQLRGFVKSERQERLENGLQGPQEKFL